jgi:hypothetical protein
MFVFGFILGLAVAGAVGFFTVRSVRAKATAEYMSLMADYEKVKSVVVKL